MHMWTCRHLPSDGNIASLLIEERFDGGWIVFRSYKQTQWGTIEAGRTYSDEFGNGPPGGGVLADCRVGETFRLWVYGRMFVGKTTLWSESEVKTNAFRCKDDGGPEGMEDWLEPEYNPEGGPEGGGGDD